MYYSYSNWLKERYGEKVYKLPVNLPGILPEIDVAVRKAAVFALIRGPGLKPDGSLNR